MRGDKSRGGEGPPRVGGGGRLVFETWLFLLHDRSHENKKVHIGGENWGNRVREGEIRAEEGALHLSSGEHVLLVGQKPARREK